MSKEQDCPYKEKIEQHEKLIDRIMHGDWYDNKQLFETMMKKFDEVSKKMDEMNINMKKYNGLIEKRQEDRRLMENNKARLARLEVENQTKEKSNSTWKDNIRWIIYVLLFLGGVATRFI
jgi:hypothetical protein